MYNRHGQYVPDPAWRQEERPDDYEDDCDDLSTNCMECEEALDDRGELLCRACTAELRSSPAPPERGEDGWIDQYHEDMITDPPF